MDIARLIQQKIPLGSKVCFTLKNGEKKYGILSELSKSHISLENNGTSSVIFLDMIGAFDVLESLGEGASEVLETKAVNENILKRLLEIESNFNVYIKTATLEFRPPDFVLPSDLQNNWHSSNIKTWDQARNKFENAQKINELDKKFGRLQQIIAGLKSLSENMPDSELIKRHLGYLYLIDGKVSESFSCLKESAFSSNELVDDWYNLAVLSLLNNNEEVCCYSLGKYFVKKIISDDIDAWYVYTKLIKKFNFYLAIPKFLENSTREFTDKEQQILLETAIYCLLINDKKTNAEEIIEKYLTNKQSVRELISETANYFPVNTSDSFLAVLNELDQCGKKQIMQQTTRNEQRHGIIQTYLKDKNFGFIYDSEGKKFFFHKSAVIDEVLSENLYKFSYDKIPVVFEVAQSPTGRDPVAIQISQKYSADELFKRAKDYANEGEYAKAISQIRRVLAITRDHPYAQEYLDKWKEYALLISVPKGSNPYAQAKRAQLIEKDLERAIQLFKESIKRKDNLESAIKDLSQLYMQLGKNQEAEDILIQNKTKLKNQHALESLLITVYQKTGKYTDAINLLQKRISPTIKNDLKEQLILQIANLYLRAKDYKNAEDNIRQVLKLNHENVAAQRNLAICLSQQGNYNKAKELLNKIIEKYSDSKAAEVLEAINRAQITGEITKADEIIIESGLSDFSIELSSFTKYFLERCSFEGVPPKRINNSKYIGSEKDVKSDIAQLEEFAKTLGTRRPRERSNYYLSAARIAFDIGESSNLFYRYLCRSFASRGDSAVSENKHIDSARSWYIESLKIYDGVRGERDEQDAVNALVRYLFSLLGVAEIPLTPKIPTIDETVEKIINLHPYRQKVFDSIAYLTLNSKYAANKLLKSLYNKSSLQTMSLEHLRAAGISILGVNNLANFVNLWNELQRKKREHITIISNELRFINNIQLSTAWLETNITRLQNNIIPLIYSVLDMQRIKQLLNILETSLELCKQVSFEDQEYFCIQIDNRCQDMLNEIESSPTHISIEQIYSVVETIKEKIKHKLDYLYETSKPQLDLQLPIESYVPDNNQQIDVQITITNKIGRSPAESVEIIVQPDEEYFSSIEPEIKIVESLSGDKQKTLKIPLKVTNLALQARTFSLGIYVQYRTRSGETEQTPVHSFSIRLYPEDEFEEIENPYASYAEGGVVGNPEMFYGRAEFIKNIAEAIKRSKNQSKSIIIYGQKRAGKSSILFHFKKLLQKEKNLLVIDLGNIGSLLDEQSSVPLLYQILWTILSKLRTSVEELIENEYPFLNLIFPIDIDFYKHPAPMSLFKEIFDKYKNECSKHKEWKDIRLLVLIDEFSYIYDKIIFGKVPETFMKNWKALLQENYFSCVLAGQDVIPKFKQHFANEFGTTQDERVTYLKPDDAKMLIDEPIRIDGRNGESRYRGKAIQRIIELTAGSPFYIQILCNRLIEHMNHKHAGLITEADVEQVKNDLIRGVNSLDVTKFDNLINSGDTSNDAISDTDALKVLKEIATNSITGHCHKNNINCETEMPIDDILEDLVKRDVIEREREHYYQIRVGLFKEWLIARK